MRLLMLIIVALAAAAPSYAQAPHADWRVLETEHFRVFYPAPFEAWTRRAAGRLESIRDRVTERIGFVPPQRMDVVVQDPAAQPNGYAWPIYGAPRIVLWTTPPGPESVIGQYRDWAELVTVHEQAHMVHLLRPSRNPIGSLREKILPLGPITMDAPRWVTEGYATVIEGELTGSGRPHGDFRATLLRKWAQMGRLPSYNQLGGDTENWMGMSMAYLVGSAYLEWLAERAGPDSLKNLWSRMSARQARSFDDDFRGVFGDTPAALYNRFKAEITERAMKAEDLIAPTAREGELFQDLSWTTEPPAVSRDGSKLATILRSRDDQPVVVVWSTSPDEKAEKEYRERIEKMLERDPQDVAPVRARPLPREPLHDLTLPNGMRPYGVRWVGNDQILFASDEPDAEGVLRSDLFIWTPDSGAIRRVTRNARVNAAEPSPDGSKAVAVRTEFGSSQLVEVDLRDGSVRELVPASVDVVYAAPRWHPDGDGILYVKQERGRWRLFVRDGDSEREITTPDDASIGHPSWSRDGSSIYATVGRAGMLDISRYTESAGWQAVTRSQGASTAAAEGATHLYFLSIDADGLDVRTVALEETKTPLPPLTLDVSLAPVVRPAPRAAEPFASVETGASRPYGIGPQEWFPLIGGTSSPSSRTFDLGLRIGDPIGRLDTLILGALGGDGGETGAALSVAWRGWPVEVGFHLFHADHDLGSQPEPFGLTSETEQTGGEVSLSWARDWRAVSLAASAGAMSRRLEVDGTRENQTAGFVTVAQQWRRTYGDWGVFESLSGSFHGGDFEILHGTAAAGMNLSDMVLTARYDRMSGDDTVLSYGGVASSILPASARAERLLSPAFPIGILRGSEGERQRATLGGLLPFDLFYERTRMWNDGSAKGEWLRSAGVEIELSETSPEPLLRIPAASLRVGAAHIFDGALEGEWTWWVSLTWRP